MIERKYQGKKFTIIHCRGAIDSYNSALIGVEARKRASYTRTLISQINRLAAGDKQSANSFPFESEFSSSSGLKIKFRCLKRIPLRGYCWLSNKNKNTYYISHYVFKDYQKLNPKDTKKVKINWIRIEEGNDDC
jgi:hypothetical protein